MTASDHCPSAKIVLASRGPSTHEAASKRPSDDSQSEAVHVEAIYWFFLRHSQGEHPWKQRLQSNCAARDRFQFSIREQFTIRLNLRLTEFTNFGSLDHFILLMSSSETILAMC